jgi:arylsulfatase
MSAADRPNLIFILPDQLRHDFLGCYGAEFLETSNIDRLAARGVRYDSAYSCHPLCVPARASLLTGRNAIRNGVTGNGSWLSPLLREEGIRTWPELLANAGYLTAAIGKMHFYPWDARHGFQYRSVAEDKRWIHVRDDYFHFLRSKGQRKYHGNEHPGYHENKGAVVSNLPWELSVDHFVGQEACRFIQDFGSDGPFAMMIGFPGPHCPYDPTQAYLSKVDRDNIPRAVPEVPDDSAGLRRQSEAGKRKPWNGVDYSEFPESAKQTIRAHYAASVMQIDHEVGQVMEALESEGLEDNTIVIVSSDHGDYLGDHNLIGKGSFFESSIHVPLIVSGAGIQPAVSRELVELSDITATLLQFAGLDRPTYYDSIALPDLGLDRSPDREYSIGMLTGGWMIQDKRFRLAQYRTGEAMLFDLQNDPDEQRNLIADPIHSDRVRRFYTALSAAIMDSVSDSCHPQRVSDSDLSSDRAFGHEGWTRQFPRPFGEPNKG